jgi:hypothetical protein
VVSAEALDHLVERGDAAEHHADGYAQRQVGGGEGHEDGRQHYSPAA